MNEKQNVDHHKRYEYCRNRLKYRQGSNLTAVRVYSAISESKHLLIFGVPKVSLLNEIKSKLLKFGPLEKIDCYTEEILQSGVELEQFTDCFHVVFKKLEIARKVKKFLDARNFYGGILHITYANELESVDQLRDKLKQRKIEVEFRLRQNQKFPLKRKPNDRNIEILTGPERIG